MQNVRTFPVKMPPIDENIKVILDVQLLELGTQGLHQRLSETFLINTLTDVRELKKSHTDLCL